MSQQYDEFARSLHSRAQAAHRAWIPTLTPAAIKLLARSGSHEEPQDDSEVGGHSPYATSDIADSPSARVDVDFAASIDTPDQELAEQFGITPSQAKSILHWHNKELSRAIERHEGHFLGIIVGGLLSSKNPKLASAGLAFAAGLDALNGLGCQSEYARKTGLSASAVSKVVKAWQRSLNLRPSAHQKSEQACLTYAEVGKKRHWRTQVLSLGKASLLLSRLKSKPTHQ